jgi:glutathione S-transferase
MSPAYELLYWPSIPGRGEFIRLALEATKTPYTDTSNASKDGINAILSLIDSKATTSGDGNPPAFAPPALKVPGAGKNGKALIIYQTPTILVRDMGGKKWNSKRDMLTLHM